MRSPLAIVLQGIVNYLSPFVILHYLITQLIVRISLQGSLYRMLVFQLAIYTIYEYNLLDIDLQTL